MNAASQSRRFQLRAETQAAHERLDAHVGDLSDRASYDSYLVGMARFRGPIEHVVQDLQAKAGPVSFTPTAIAHLVEQDLADLGSTYPKHASMPIFKASRSSLLGVLYVLEGSALGARLLFQRAKALGLSAEHGARHLARQSESVDAWRALVADLDAEPAIDLAEAIEAATKTFDAAQSAFAGADDVRS